MAMTMTLSSTVLQIVPVLLKVPGLSLFPTKDPKERTKEGTKEGTKERMKEGMKEGTTKNTRLLKQLPRLTHIVHIRSPSHSPSPIHRPITTTAMSPTAVKPPRKRPHHRCFYLSRTCPTTAALSHCNGSDTPQASWGSPSKPSKKPWNSGGNDYHLDYYLP